MTNNRRTRASHSARSEADARYANDIEHALVQQRPASLEPSIAQGMAAAEDLAEAADDESPSTLRARDAKPVVISSRNAGFFMGLIAVGAVGVLALMIFVLPQIISNSSEDATAGDIASTVRSAPSDQTSIRIAIEPRPASLALAQEGSALEMDAQNGPGVSSSGSSGPAVAVRKVATRQVREPRSSLDPSFYQAEPDTSASARSLTGGLAAGDGSARILDELQSAPTPALAHAPREMTAAIGRAPVRDENARATEIVNSPPRNPVRVVDTIMSRAGVSASETANPAAGGAETSPSSATQPAFPAPRLAANPVITQSASGLVSQPQPKPAEALAAPIASAPPPARAPRSAAKRQPQWVERAFGFGHDR